MKKLRVAVLFGGPSAEHEVSVKSGLNVIKNLSKTFYEVIPVFIDKTNLWTIGGYLRSDSDLSNQAYSLGAAIDYLRDDLKIDIAFIALHGTFGEDGTIQGLLKFAGIPFTGSGVLGSALSMDKLQSWQLYKSSGLRVPEQSFLGWKENNYSGYDREYPCIVKPNALGSTIGVSVVHDDEEYDPAIKLAQQYGTNVVIQKYIDGTEVTCGVIDNGTFGSAQALIPTEIVFGQSNLFDYHAKYEPNAAEEITPARLNEETLKEVQQYAVIAHMTLNCSGLSRSDFIVGHDGEVFILETNSIPGLTDTSLITRALPAMHMTFSELLFKIIQAGLIANS